MTPKQEEEYRKAFIEAYPYSYSLDVARVAMDNSADYWLNIIKQREEELVRECIKIVLNIQKGVKTHGENDLCRDIALQIESIINPNEPNK